MGLLGVARANTAVGVSPETFLLLLLQRVCTLGPYLPALCLAFAGTWQCADIQGPAGLHATKGLHCNLQAGVLTSNRALLCQGTFTWNVYELLMTCVVADARHVVWAAEKFTAQSA
jgi:hypothetical protein